MSSALRRAVRAGVVGFACGLIVALSCSVRAEVALVRAGLTGLIIAASIMLASSLNLEITKSDEESGLDLGQTDQDGV